MALAQQHDTDPRRVEDGLLLAADGLQLGGLALQFDGRLLIIGQSLGQFGDLGEESVLFEIHVAAARQQAPNLEVDGGERPNQPPAIEVKQACGDK